MMRGVRRFTRRLATLFRFGRAESELAREITAHLQLLEDQFVEKGMSREEARVAARRTFGGVEQAKEHQRDARTFRWLAGWPMDLKLGVRMLVKSPGLTVIGVIALAVAIGASAAYLEFTRDALSPTLPVEGADRIVGIQIRDTERRALHPRALHEFAALRGETRSLDIFGAARDVDRHLLTDDGRTDLARSVEISASAFRLIPHAALLGRTLSEDDERPSAPLVVVVGHDVWQSRFNADPTTLGREVRLGSAVYTIVGVMPEGFGFPINANVWVPLKVPAAGVRPGDGGGILMFGRLRPGVNVDAASAELTARLIASAGASTSHPARIALVQPYVDSFLYDVFENETVMVLVRAANLFFVMLLGICGANVATLVFARTAMRESEITVRTALGASRGRISAQLFAEALVLSSLAVLAGLAVARTCGLWIARLYADGIGQPMPFWWDNSLSLETILYALMLAVFAAAIVGVIPALKATGAQLQGRLREAGAAGSTMKFGRLWTSVIVMQAALTVAFLATVVALGWDAYRGQKGMDVTFAREQFLAARLVMEQPTIEMPGAGAQALQAILDRLKAEPGVVNATYATVLPVEEFESFNLQFPPTPEGQALEAEANARKRSDALWSEGARVGLNYFETVGIPLVAGRLFSDSEILGGRHVAIVDETFVREALGGRSPLGLTVREPAARPGETPGPWYEIVGVVKDVTILPNKGIDDAMVYRPAGSASQIRLLVRTQGAAAPLSQRLQAAALSATPDARLLYVKTLEQVADDNAIPARMFLRIFAVIAAIALLLSTAGIYALISFTLARRTREIGIRVALGAGPQRIVTSVFSRAFTQIGIGVLVGAVPSIVILGGGTGERGELGLAGGIGAALGVCAFVILVAMISCFVPLRRALRIEPMQALRSGE